MPTSCVVPKCRTGYKSYKTKCSVFRVPSDVERRKKWEAAIPGDKKLRATDVVCEKHFEKKYILCEWIRYDPKNPSKIIARSAYKHPQLCKLAVPTRFDENVEDQKAVDSIRPFFDAPSLLMSVDSDLATSNPSSDESLAPLSTHKDIETSEQCIPVSVKEVEESPVEYNVTTNGLPPVEMVLDLDVSLGGSATECAAGSMECSPNVDAVKNNGTLAVTTNGMDLSMEIHNENPPTDTIASPSAMTEKLYPVISTVIINAKFQEGNNDSAMEYSTVIPNPWSAAELRDVNGKHIVFQYTVRKENNGVRTPVQQKCVAFDANGQFEYFVYGRRVEIEGTILDRTVGEDGSVCKTLEAFQRMRVCAGLGTTNKSIPIEDAFMDNAQQWRHDNCTLISKHKRCACCMKLRNRINARIRNIKIRLALKRIRKPSNAFDARKVAVLLKRTADERRHRRKAEGRVTALTNELQKAREKIAQIEDATLEKRCSQLNVPQAQKLALKEIINAANREDTRGRRYAEEWMMLCMLLNIRSKGTYEFLRKNNVLPLPCSGTIRRYFSRIDFKCGFDEKFGELLKKHFQTRTPLQRHGILLLDEINLRKSVAVCSKNLTYVGLTDLGEDGLQSTDINDQATHGLVLMFQSLADKYTQPIAVFASKNPVKGEELAKLTVKGITFLENCGAKIHGVVADGAATNAKMWSVLGVSGAMENTKTWFTHPLDGERKVFVFSDVPHLIQNVRNRLYNKKNLRLKRTQNSIRWQYFQSLYEIDKNLPDNMRACPKITARHVVLDSTAKMRVKLATQIFSNSVAKGLAFYQSHKSEAFKDCGETIDFCLKINDMFDALNRKSPNQELTPGSTDFKVLEDSLCWLNEWESAMVTKDIAADEFLPSPTSKGLRISLTSTMDMCRYLINKFDFQYLLSGKVNQDNLEKFFGTIRQASGSNDHPSCFTFLQLYKLLSIYSVIKPPKYGNCSVSTDTQTTTVISMADLKLIYGEKGEAKSAKYIREIQMKLDSILQHDDWEADDVLDYNPDHDYHFSPILDCIIYYVTGYLCKQVLKKYKSCTICENALRQTSSCVSSVAQFVQLKSRGGLIHANLHFFNLIRCVEATFAKYASHKYIFDRTLDEILETHTFTLPCTQHGPDILSYAIVYYIRLRMRQNTYQENLKQQKKFVVKNKLSKLTNE